MNRRTFLCGLTLNAFAAPLAAQAQEAGKVYRIAIVHPVLRQLDAALVAAFKAATTTIPIVRLT